MEFVRKITKTGLTAQGGLPIPSPFYYRGTSTGVMFANEGVGFSGGFYISLDSEESIIIKNGLSQSHGGKVNSNIGGVAAGACTCSADELVHTIDIDVFTEQVDALIVSKLEGCALEDISAV